MTQLQNRWDAIVLTALCHFCRAARAILKGCFGPSSLCQQGATLIELCIAMMIISILCVGAAGLIRAGVEAQLNDRAYTTMQMVANNIASDLRFDLMTASAVQIQGGGNTLSINNGTIVYSLDAATGNFTRTQNGNAKLYNRVNTNTDYAPRLTVGCFAANQTTQVACFTGCRMEESPAGSGNFVNTCPPTGGTAPTSIRLANLSILSPALQNSFLQGFDTVPPRFRMDSTTFHVLSSLTFQ